VQTGAGHNSRVAEYSVSVRSFMWTGRAELLTSPIMPGTSPVFEPTFDFCESAVFTIVLKMQQLFSPHGFRCIYSTNGKNRARTARQGRRARGRENKITKNEKEKNKKIKIKNEKRCTTRSALEGMRK